MLAPSLHHHQVVLVLALSLWMTSYRVQCADPTPMTISYSVLEEQPAGTKVGRLADDLRQRGEQGSPGEDFQVAERGQALPFAVSPRGGEVSTLGRLDREELCRGADLCQIAFSVLYRKGGNMHFLNVRVEVSDLNDHSPAFPSPEQDLEISETAALGMRIPLERAVDLDAGQNGLQTYTMASNEHFALEVRSGSGGTKQAELVVIKELDREVLSSIDLTVLAFDKGSPPRSGMTNVRIRILDSNDNSPVFEDATPSVELPEDTSHGTVVINLHATDPDEGANGEIEFSLSKYASADVQRTFSVHPKTGAVTLVGPLDYERKSSYEVDIQARDMGPNAIPSHCKLQVKLQDVNDNAPRIHVTWIPPDSAVATVSEGAPNDTFLALVMVSDADSGENGEVRANLDHGSGHFRLKRVHGDNYIIVTNGTLDREKTMEYNLTLFARDNGQPSLACVRYLTVRVLDENDNSPVFSKTVYKASFKENNQPGYQVLTVDASDVDLELSSKVSYSIRESNDLGAPSFSFAVHPTTGVVTVHQSLDYEESQVYTFVVEAIDHGHPPLTSSATVLIQLQDDNDNYPEIVEPPPKGGVAKVSIPVNAEKGEIVAEVGERSEEKPIYLPTNRTMRQKHQGYLATAIKAHDADSDMNGKIHFRIVDGNPSRLFWLDTKTGQLYVNTTNATDLIGKTFKVGIAVSDMGTPVLVTRTTLEVTFINLLDHLKNSSPGQQAQLSFTMLMAICLGASCLLLLLAVALVTTFCRPQKRDNHAYNCRQAESSYASHPRRPKKHIHKTDIQLVPVLRGRRDDHTEEEIQPLSSSGTPPPPPPVEIHPDGQYTMALPLTPRSAYSHHAMAPDFDQMSTLSHTKTLRKPGSIELDGSVPHTPSTQYRTLRKARNLSSSTTSSGSQTGTLRRPTNVEVHSGTLEAKQGNLSPSASQATLRRPKNTDSLGRQAEHEHRQMLRNLVRLSMAAFGDNCPIELSSASPEVQVSQLLSLLHQGQFQPRPNFRGNKYSHRTGRLTAQDADWLSTKDSGHGESEAGDMDWEAGRDSPVDPLLEEGLHNLINSADDVFGDVTDPSWIARLSLPLAGDYHANIFTPDGPQSPDSRHGSQSGPGDDPSSSFSTFGKNPDKGGPLGGGALLSEVSTLFEMLLTQKADAQPQRPAAEVLYRLSAAYRRSLGLDTPPMGGGAGGGAGVASPSPLAATRHHHAVDSDNWPPPPPPHNMHSSG
ncbi:protocadherin-12 isoform X2 [Engraulis encrasicolus]|uniref:protocadherin-12 isoform X2 n=1 Tax=Engraulis encrasicolus TaxID=184585 RepID=UPI002FD05DA1